MFGRTGEAAQGWRAAQTLGLQGGLSRAALIHVPSLLTWHLLLPGEAAQGWRAAQSLGLKLHLEAGLGAAGLPKVAIEVGVYDVLEFRPAVLCGFSCSLFGV